MALNTHAPRTPESRILSCRHLPTRVIHRREGLVARMALRGGIVPRVRARMATAAGRNMLIYGVGGADRAVHSGLT
jgi:ribosomal protein L34